MDNLGGEDLVRYGAAAMAAWEHVLFRIAAGRPKWVALHRRWGNFRLRMKMSAIMATMMKAYKLACDNGFTEDFELHFMPLFLDEFTDGQGEVIPNWRAIIKARQLKLIKL